jgi:hypothetical protein
VDTSCGFREGKTTKQPTMHGTNYCEFTEQIKQKELQPCSSTATQNPTLYTSFTWQNAYEVLANILMPDFLTTCINSGYQK